MRASTRWRSTLRVRQSAALADLRDTPVRLDLTADLGEQAQDAGLGPGDHPRLDLNRGIDVTEALCDLGLGEAQGAHLGDRPVGATSIDDRVVGNGLSIDREDAPLDVGANECLAPVADVPQRGVVDVASVAHGLDPDALGGEGDQVRAGAGARHETAVVER